MESCLQQGGPSWRQRTDRRFVATTQALFLKMTCLTLSVSSSTLLRSQACRSLAQSLCAWPELLLLPALPSPPGRARPVLHLARAALRLRGLLRQRHWFHHLKFADSMAFRGRRCVSGVSSSRAGRSRPIRCLAAKGLAQGSARLFSCKDLFSAA